MDLNFYLGCIKFSTLVAILFASCFANLDPFVFLDYGVGISELLLVELYLRKSFSLHCTCNINLQCKHIKIVNIVCICKKCKIFTTFYKYV